MASTKTLVVAMVGALAFVANASAADMPQWRPVEVVPVMDLAGWYLRADLGYRGTLIQRAESPAALPSPVTNDLDGQFWGGVGAGFKWHQIRTDLTLDATTPATYTGSGGGAAANAHIQTFTSLANAYYDIGTWRRVTPYIGAGIGLAHVRVSDYQSLTTPPLSTVDTVGRTNMAWALMAGLNYQAWRNLSVDVGYRFLDQGDAVTGTDASGTLVMKDLQSHEVRIGLRWMYSAPWAYTH